jgi:hypothetical protein
MTVPYLSPEQMDLCAAVLAKACSEVGNPDGPTRDLIAARIIAVALSGELDPEKLRTHATAGLTRLRAAS